MAVPASDTAREIAETIRATNATDTPIGILADYLRDHDIEVTIHV